MSTRIEAHRRIQADPASTALLLAGPSALELWPGVRRVGEVGGRVLIEVAGPAPTAASVTARPPRRTPTAFVSRFAWTGPGLPGTEGVLTLTYAQGAGAPTTRAELVLDSEGLAASQLDEAALAGMAEQFLVNLARAAEARRAA
ncbi:MAG: hypothetical protein H7323_13720 [Frankiales bacterium]|nr:hypothetical protein [Frankiales bacterium]